MHPFAEASFPEGPASKQAIMGSASVMLYQQCTGYVSIQVDLLSVNYCANYSLNNGLYCTKWAHSYLLFAKLLCGIKSSIMGCVPIFIIAWTEMFSQ